MGAVGHPTAFSTLTIEYVFTHLLTTKSEKCPTELELHN